MPMNLFEPRTQQILLSDHARLPCCSYWDCRNPAFKHRFPANSTTSSDPLSVPISRLAFLTGDQSTRNQSHDPNWTRSIGTFRVRQPFSIALKYCFERGPTRSRRLHVRRANVATVKLGDQVCGANYSHSAYAPISSGETTRPGPRTLVEGCASHPTTTRGDDRQADACLQARPIN
jgi:hypothetical protein